MPFAQRRSLADMAVSERRVRPLAVMSSSGRFSAAASYVVARSAIPLLALAAITLGFFVSRGQWLAPAGVLILIAVLFATRIEDTLLAAVMIAAALLGPPVVSIGGIPELGLAELIVPVMLLVVVLRRVSPHHAVTPSGAARFPRIHSGRAINLAVGAYALVIIMNYVRAHYLLGVTVTGTKRAFYDYFVALGAYLIFYWLFTSPGLVWHRLFRFMFWLSAVMCTLGVGAVMLHQPLNFGVLRYSVYDYTSGAVRVGFLETFGTVGLALVLTMRVRFRFAMGLLFVAALVASGGRGAVVGAAVAVALYLIVTRRSWQVVTIGIVAVLLVLAVPTIGSSPQVQRLSQLNEQGLARADRLFLYSESLRRFARQPLTGTGLGVPIFVSNPDPWLAAFYDSQLETGGHATYTSLLKNFGLLGFLPYIAALVFAVIRLSRLAPVDPVAGFFLILLLAVAISLSIGGNGSDPVYFFALAGAAATLAGASRHIAGSRTTSPYGASTLRRARQDR
jgi:hypothetical protein